MSDTKEVEATVQGLQKASKERRKEIKKAEKMVLGRGQDHQQQLRALEKKMIKVEATHRRRVARLKRIRLLAVQADKSEIVKRVDKLLKKERHRYESKLMKTNQKMEKVRHAMEEEN